MVCDMLRLYDWLCAECSTRTEALVDVPHGTEPPKNRELFCSDCGEHITHNRTISLVAPYTGEHIRNPEVYGGSCDTMGHRRVQDLPDLPGAAEHSAETARKLRALPDNASHEDRRAVLREQGKTAPSGADYASLFSTNEYKEKERKRARDQKENALKRKRAKAHKAGANINFRRDRCAGDPKI